MREQCAAGAADWYVEGVSGFTYCPKTQAPCQDSAERQLGDGTTEHDRFWGTVTNELSMFFQGEEPTEGEIRELITDPDQPGWYLNQWAEERLGPEPGKEWTSIVEMDGGQWRARRKSDGSLEFQHTNF
ncbi:hypothetical protein ACIA78_21845 [Streptomyces xanthochromogenes]|uniref:hypothetical protein n=1 Tax=Streptomyces xanthochromogenes TaxID=67384 RepID=UPI0037B681C3